MRIKSTSHSYGAVAIAIHWIAAALIILLLLSGFRAAADPITKVAVLRIHAVAGVLLLILTLGRIAWWLCADDKPLPVDGTSSALNRVAAFVHALFYIVIFGMAASGIGMMVVSGAGAILFGASGGTLPDFWNYPPRIPHGFGARLLIALLVLHVGGALYHQFIRGDRLLARIGIGR
jgi:cytochrome b561